MFPRSDRRTGPSTGGVDAGGNYCPYHPGTTPPIRNIKTTDFLSLERMVLRHAKQHDFAVALLEETELQLSDDTAKPEDLFRNGCSQQRIRRAQHDWSSLLAPAGSEAVEFVIENSSTPEDA